MAKSIGIDLGTTNSCVAVLEGGDPTVITNSEGADDAFGRGLRQEEWRAAGRAVGQEAGCHEPGAHGLFDQALYGAALQ